MVPVTGLGLITPIGLDRATSESFCAAGRTAWRRSQSFFYGRGLAAQTVRRQSVGFDAANYLEKKDASSA